MDLYGAEGDKWYNYDLKSASLHNNNVDWPVTFVFRDNAKINKVKNRLEDNNTAYGIFRSGSSKRLRLLEGGEYKNGKQTNNTTQWKYDGDSGIKDEPNCTNGQGRHLRVYADKYRTTFGGTKWSPDRLYNDAWGFYILGTTHVDFNDGCSGAWHGYSENAEDWFAFYANNVPGWSVSNDCCWLSNREGWPTTRVDGGSVAHYWKNSGYATYVEVP